MQSDEPRIAASKFSSCVREFQIAVTMHLSLNTILELELAGVVRYLHYSLMVFGHARIPIIGWMLTKPPRA